MKSYYLSYYLWCGIGAIEELEDCTTRDQAIKELDSKSDGDWTVWERTGLGAILLAVKVGGVKQRFPE